MADVVLAALIVFAVAAVVFAAGRYRRELDPEERRRMGLVFLLVAAGWTLSLIGILLSRV